MSAVLFLTGESCGDTFKIMGESYQSVFSELGYDFFQIDLRHMDQAFSQINAIVNAHPIEFAFSFMNYGAALPAKDEKGQVQSLWNGIGVPFLSLMGDSPAYFFDLNVHRIPNQALLYGYAEHEALRRKLPAVANGYIGSFRPLCVDMLDADDVDFSSKARGQLYFLKNGNDPRKLWDSWDALSHRPLRALRELATYLAEDLANPLGNQIDDIVVSYFSHLGYDLSTMPKLRMFFIAQLDDYLRRVKSTMMGQALMGFPVQILGKNWEHLDFSGGKATYVDDHSFENSRRLIRDGLGVIDMSPNTGSAPHDRACRAFGSYTLCLTNEQEYFQQKLPLHEEFSFRFDREAFQQKIADVLAHPGRYVDIGIEVATAFRNDNPAEAAAIQMLDIAAMIRLDQRRGRLPDSPDFFIWPPQYLN